MANNKQKKANGYKGNIKKSFELRVNLTPKNIFLWLFIGLIILMIIIGNRDVSKLFPPKPLSNLIVDIKDGKVKKVEVVDSKLLATSKDNKIYTSNKENQDSFYKILSDSKI